MNSVVSFELAKLLKENGFGLKVFYFYQGDNLNQNSDCFLFNHSIRGDHYISAPTIAEVVMWLYEKHGIWVSVNHSRSLLFYPYIYKNGEQIEGGEYSYTLISEAYETSIEYVLKNLI